MLTAIIVVLLMIASFIAGIFVEKKNSTKINAALTATQADLATANAALAAMKKG